MILWWVVGPHLNLATPTPSATPLLVFARRDHPLQQPVQRIVSNPAGDHHQVVFGYRADRVGAVADVAKGIGRGARPRSLSVRTWGVQEIVHEAVGRLGF